MADTSGKLSYYKSLYSDIKGVNSNWEILGNPGTSTLQSYLSPAPAAADKLVTFENGTGYSAYTPSSWQAGFSPSSFANIVYAVPDSTTMQADLSLAGTDRAGNVYFTDASGSNPYSRLPTYWSQEVAAVRTFNLTSTYILTGAGDYNSAGSWSTAVPNSVDAEAAFLGSITAPHTVYSDSAITLGKIVFNNANTYVLAGAGSLKMQTSAGSASIDAMAGIQKITLPITLASSTVLNADAGASLIIDAPVSVGAGLTLSETGAGSVVFQSTVTVQSGGVFNVMAGSSIDSLTLTTAATAEVVDSVLNGNLPVQAESLSLVPGSRLDLNRSDLIVHDGDLATITSLVRAGILTGNGNTGSATVGDSTSLATLGVILNADQGRPIYFSFDETAATAGDVLVKYTKAGDANLDGIVDGSDYTLIDNGFNARLTGWYNGDFNYDGIVDGSDYSLIDNAFSSAAASLSAESTAQTTQLIGGFDATLPEPVAGCLLFLGLILNRRRQSRRAPRIPR